MRVLRMVDDRSAVVVGWRVVILLAGVFAEIWNIANLIGEGEPANQHFAYFTIQANLLALFCFAWLLLRDDRPRWFESLRGAMTSYVMLAGLVWALLLATPTEVWTVQVEYTSFAQHRLIPVLVVLDWLVVPPRHRLPVLRSIGLWMLYPIAYLACSWVRGALFDGWIPYPFIDPAAHGGIAGLVVPVGQVLAAFLVGITLVAVAGRLRQGRGNPPPTAG